MIESSHSRARDESPAKVGRGLAAIVLLGALLGLAYNYLGLDAGSPKAIAWIGQDPAEALRSMGTVVAATDPAAPLDAPSALPAFVSDDPLAIPATTQQAARLPEIPDVGRPVEIELAAVKQLVDAGAATLVDARETVEFEEGRIPGALSLPYDEVVTDPARIEELDTRDRPVVIYCGGGSCEVSINLAWELLAFGHGPVAVYMGGFPEWEEAGYPVEREAATRTGG